MNSALDFPTLDVDEMAAPIVASEVVDIAEIRDGKAVVHLNRTAQAIAELTTLYADAKYDMTTTAGDKAARSARLVLVTTRTAIESKRKALKAPALEFGKIIDSEAARLTKLVSDLEDPIDAQIKAEERRRQEEREEAERREAGRIAKHESGIATIRSYLSRCAGLPSSRIEMGIDQLSAMTFTAESWEEFAVPAANAQCETLESMRALLAKTRAAEEQDAETRRLRAVVEEQARELAELRAQAAKVAAAEAERLELQQLKEDAQRAALADAIVAESLRQAEEDGDKPAAQEAAPVCAAFAGLSFADPVAEPPVKEPAYMIGDLCHKVGAGFSMTAEFVAGLGFKPSKSDGRSKLYTETQCAGIKAALIARIEERL